MAQSLEANLSQFERTIQVAFFEQVATNYQLFNANSNGAITIGNAQVIGTLPETGYFIQRDTVARRDTTSSSARTLTGMTQSSWKNVVLAKEASDDIALSALKQHDIDPMMYARNVGIKFANDTLEDELSSALSAGVGTLSKQAASKNDVSADSSSNTISVAHLFDSKYKMGDRSTAIRAIVMHSKPATDLKKEFGTSPNLVTEIGAGVIRDDSLGMTLGAPVYITDNSALATTSGSSSTAYAIYRTLLLVEGGLNLKQDITLPLASVIDRSYVNAVMMTTMEWHTELGVKGLSFTGSTYPTDANLATSSNWTLKAASIKDAAGVILLTR